MTVDTLDMVLPIRAPAGLQPAWAHRCPAHTV